MPSQEIKNYQPTEIEGKWYAHWVENKYFQSNPDHREPYTIVIPPPNVTGVLHMGHMLNNTVQDILIRRARMQGKNACWVPGTDHASIATEAKVVKLLREQGLKKSDIGREKFLEHAFAWKEKYGGIILDQLKKLGASVDWQRTKFTMEPALSESVQDAFIKLYEQGFLYRDKKMVNWDPVAKTTLSNEEVIYKEEEVTMVYVKYKLVDSDGYISVATVRPETIMGDVAIAVHPKDERYAHLIGKKVIVPIVDREVPVVTDEGIDMAFGTGALKVTPAHDSYDFTIGKKYGLQVIDCFNEDGSISQEAQAFVGMDRWQARKEAIQFLLKNDLIEKQENIIHKVGLSERTDAVVEPRLSVQWFVKMDEMVKPALDSVLNQEIKIVPDRYTNLYKHWLENIRDWPISRQLWWGQQIPAWYNENQDIAVCKTKEEAIDIFKNKKQSIENIYQDEDVVDTWFSSWLWPISVFDPKAIQKGWEKANEDLKYYYPTQVLVTGWDIIFFWVARMVFAGYQFIDKKPFESVYFTGMVRDKQRRKMSKSLGNSPDAVELINTYGADGLRFSLISSAAAGNDIMFDEKLCEQGRNFANKLWNAMKLTLLWEIDKSKDGETLAAEWMLEKIKMQTLLLNQRIDQFQLSEGLKELYSLIWDDFCASYLEWIKPNYGEALPYNIYKATLEIWDLILAMLHPFMPFVTEEIYHKLQERNGKDLVISQYPKFENYNQDKINHGNDLVKLITQIRETKAKNQLKPKEEIGLFILTDRKDYFNAYINILKKLVGVSSIQFESEPNDGLSFMLDKTKVTITSTQGNINTEQQKTKWQEELEYLIGFKESVLAKLNNEKFVSTAPEKVVAMERKKLNDAEEKIKLITESLEKM